MSDNEALVIAHRADAKVDIQTSILKELIAGVSNKIDSVYHNLDHKIELMRSENSDQHSQARKERDEQNLIISTSLSKLTTAVEVKEEQLKNYTDEKDTATNNRINKIMWWALGMLGTGATAGIGVDKLFGG